MNKIIFLLIIYINNFIYANQIFKLDGLNYNIRNGTDWEPDNCKSLKQIEEELIILSTITSNIRIYSLIDCNQGFKILNILKKINIKIWLGLWVSEDKSIFINEKNELIKLINLNLIDNNILGISIGSESLYRNETTINELFDYINIIKNILITYNLNILITTADIIDIYLDYPILIENLDILLINQFPFWEKIPLESSMNNFLLKYNNLTTLNKLNKTIIIGETGWSSNGYDNRTSIASLINQAKYFIEFYNIANLYNWKYFYFSSFDELWKNKQLNKLDNVESHFGLFYENGTIKEEIYNVINLSNYTIENNKTKKDKIKNNKIENNKIENNKTENNQNININQSSKEIVSIKLIILLFLVILIHI